MLSIKTTWWFLLFTVIPVFFLNMQVPDFPENSILPVSDSITPPPDSPDTLTGPSESCVGDTAVYSAELPVSCTAQWYIDTVLQSSGSGILQVVWADTGNYAVILYFNCDSGTVFSDSLMVTVYKTPMVDLGNDTTISEGQNLILDAGNTGSRYLWSTGDTTRSIVVSEAGEYSVVVTNFCGEDGDTVFVDVIDDVPDFMENGNPRVVVHGDLLSVEIPGLEIQQVYISDLSGRTIYKGTGKRQIHLPGNGIYILEIKTDKGVFIRKAPVF